MNAAKKTEFPPQPCEKKTLAMIQLTRFGDVLQTFQAALEFKEQHPEIRLVLIARKKFAKPLAFLLNQAFDKIYYFDFASCLEGATALNDVSKKMGNFFTEISEENIDVLVNLSFSKSSAYIAHLIKAVNKMGMVYDDKNQLHIKDRWSQFVYSNVMGTAFNPLNLVDIFKFILGVKGTETLSVTDTQKKVSRLVIHPFASNAKKRWRPTKWVEVLFKVLRENDKLEVILVGDKNEALQAEQIRLAPVLAPFVSRIQNFAGKKSIEDVTTVLNSEALFVGHDSMVGHLAAIKGARVVTVSLGTVRPAETTPYIAGAYNIVPRSKCFPCFPQDSCELHQCHADIPYQVVSGVLGLLIRGEEMTAKSVEKATSLFHLSSVDIHRSSFSSAGLFETKPLTEHEPLVADVFRQIYRITWLYLLAGVEEHQTFPQLTAHGHKELLQRMAGLQYLFELCDFGKKYSRYILEEISSPTPSILKIKDHSRKIDEIDSLQALVKKNHPQLAPIVDLFVVAKGNLVGNNLVELTESSYLAFDDSKVATGVVFELIEKIIAEYKIKTGVGKLTKEEYHR